MDLENLFECIFEEFSLTNASNQGCFGLEYVRQNSHLDSSGMLLENVKAMLEIAKEKYGQMLRSLNLYESGRISAGLKKFDQETADFNRGKRFKEIALRDRNFDLTEWKTNTRKLIRKINMILSGKKLSKDEVIILQQFLNQTSLMILREIISEREAYTANRRFHPI
jgi:hypothetical protein